MDEDGRRRLKDCNHKSSFLLTTIEDYGLWAVILWWWFIASIIVRLYGGVARVINTLVPPRTKCSKRIVRGRPAQKAAWEVAATETKARGPVPPLHVAVLVVGTRGDVDPFCSAAIEIARRGHRVRIAAHAVYRGFVAERAEKAGVELEFYPLAGDPRRLSQWMVESGGRLLPEMSWKDLNVANEKMIMIQAILHSCWPACTDRDPDAPDWGLAPFRAQAILSNPIAYGHVHCAEALRCPLLVAFPQPWTPTTEFPHVFAGLPFTATDDDSRVRAAKNYASYKVVDELQWQGLDAPTWRRDVLGLAPLHANAGSSLINDLRVPFAGMWSPSLLKRTADAGDHVCVVGAQRAPADDGGAIDEHLATFLAEGEPPIFLGFGSMVIGDPAVLWDLIVTAAEAAGERVVAQSSWSTLEGSKASPLVLAIGPMPHSRLFPKCGAAVHHGGAGTVHATLGAGLPTLVVPFFGDQPLWGEVCRRKGVGPAPIPFAELTSDNLAEAFRTLMRDEGMRARAREVAAELAAEDGVEGLVTAWTRSLPPSRDLVCWASLFCVTEPKVQAAERWHTPLGMRLSLEAEAAVSADDSPYKAPWVYPYATRFWDTRSGVYAGSRFINAVPELFVQLLYGLGHAVAKPFKSSIEAYNQRNLRGPGEAALAAFISFVVAVFEVPIVLVARILYVLVRAAIEILDAVTCSYFSGRVLFDAPDHFNNINSTQKLKGEPASQGAGATAAVRPVEDVVKRALANDEERQRDLVDAAALGARVRDALAATCPLAQERECERLDVITPDHARAALASLLKIDWDLLRAPSLRGSDLESEGSGRTIELENRESRKDLDSRFSSPIGGGGSCKQLGDAPAGGAHARGVSDPPNGPLRNRFQGKPKRKHGSATLSARFERMQRMVRPSRDHLVDHDRYARAFLARWDIEKRGWVPVVPLCLRVAELYHEANSMEDEAPPTCHDLAGSLSDVKEDADLSKSGVVEMVPAAAVPPGGPALNAPGDADTRAVPSPKKKGCAQS
mmetsp:Transcript_3340/g.10110  ORF Transcript_3340/g.10110 Transcript_3340/m.10110 type:complete len:1014 (-) Transcript_3340:101-3142(-)